MCANRRQPRLREAAEEHRRPSMFYKRPRNSQDCFFPGTISCDQGRALVSSVLLPCVKGWLSQLKAKAIEGLKLHRLSRPFVNYDDLNTLGIEMEVGDGSKLS